MCTCKDLPQRPYGMKPTYNMRLSINLSLLCIRHLSQIHSNPTKIGEKVCPRQTREYFCCHIDPHCLGLRSLCGVPPKRTNRWSCPKLQLMSFWATRTSNPNHYAGLLGAFTKLTSPYYLFQLPSDFWRRFSLHHGCAPSFWPFPDQSGYFCFICGSHVLETSVSIRF